MVLLFQNCSGSEFTALSSTGPQAQASVTPPTLVISEAPPALSNLRSFDFKFSAKTSPAANLQFISCTLDGGPAQSCTNGFTALDLADGDHILKVKAQDSLGHSSDEVVYLWKIDATKPIVTINQKPAAVTGVTSVSFAFSGNEAASFLCAMNAEAMAPCTSPVMRTLVEGTHSFKIQAVDTAKNASELVTSSFKVDLTAPALNILTKPAVLVGTNTASFTFSGTDDGMTISVFSCKLDNQVAAACNAGSMNYTNLSEGSHTFALSGQDSAGNMSTAISYTWAVDLTAPSAPVVNADVPASTKNTAATFMFSSTDLNGIKSYECQIDAGAFALCTSPKTYSGLSIANHTFAVRARDQVDNLSAAGSFAWTITAPPTPTPTPVPTPAPTATPVPTPAPGAPGIYGRIDSSLMDRFATTGNAIYVFQGSVTPDDVGSATPPLHVIPVIQDKCSFNYQTPALSAGTYTLAFTQQASMDNAGSNDAVSFIKTAVVTYTNATLAQAYNFPPARVLTVGAGKTYAKPSMAIDVSQAGDVIEINSGDYLDDFATIDTNITLRGVGATRPRIKRVNGNISNGKGIWVTTGKVNIENVEISGSRVGDANGAGVRIENDTVICNSYIWDNEDGVLGDAPNILIEYSEFAYNGLTDVGYNHNIYVNAGVFTLRYSFIHDAGDPANPDDTGHNVKSRSKTNYILYNFIGNLEADAAAGTRAGTASDQINLPQGGRSFIVGNLIRESAHSHSNRIILFYDGGDGPANASLDLYMVNNTIISDDGEAYLTKGSGTNVRAYNNLLWGSPKTIGANTQSNNVFSSDPSIFMNKNTYDYRLTTVAKTVMGLIDGGLSLSSIAGFTLPVNREYLHKTNGADRPLTGTQLDVGALEAR